MSNIRFSGSVLGPKATEEEAQRISEIVRPMAEVLLGLSKNDLFNVMGSLLLTYAVNTDNPVDDICFLAEMVIDRVPEAFANIQAVN